MFVLATVPTDGTIRVLGCPNRSNSTWASVVHRESRDVHEWGMTCYSTLADAKAACVQVGDNPAVVLALSKEGGGETVWTFDVDTVTQRVAKWKGCYGAWAVKRLNA